MTDPLGIYQQLNWLVYELIWIGIVTTIIAITLIVMVSKDTKDE